MKANGSQLREITRLLDAGAVRPVIDRVFPFEQTNEALADGEVNRADGQGAAAEAQPGDKGQHQGWDQQQAPGRPFGPGPRAERDGSELARGWAERLGVGHAGGPPSGDQESLGREGVRERLCYCK